MGTQVIHSQPQFVEDIVNAAAAAITEVQTDDQKKSLVLVVERPNFMSINLNPKSLGGSNLLRTSLVMKSHVVASESDTPMISEETITNNARAVHISNTQYFDQDDKENYHVAVVFETNAGSKGAESVTRHYLPKERFDKKLVTAAWHDQSKLSSHIANFLLNGTAPV